MKKTIFLMAVLMTMNSFAQSMEDESVSSSTFTITTPTYDYVGKGGPIVTSVEKSLYEGVYDVGNRQGLLSKIRYKGYNPGPEQTRHVVIWMQDGGACSSLIGFHSESEMTKVFEGDCMIPHGGSEYERIILLDISLDQPFNLTQNGLLVKVLCTGEVTEDIYFEQTFIWNQARLATFGIDDPIEGNGESFSLISAEFTVFQKVGYVRGNVTDQDGNPIQGAKVTYKSYIIHDYQYEGFTDADGHYEILIEQGD